MIKVYFREAQYKDVIDKIEAAFPNSKKISQMFDFVRDDFGFSLNLKKSGTERTSFLFRLDRTVAYIYVFERLRTVAKEDITDLNRIQSLITKFMVSLGGFQK